MCSHTSLIRLSHHITSHHITSLQPQLRGVILVTDFEDQLDLYDSKDEEEDYSGSLLRRSSTSSFATVTTMAMAKRSTDTEEVEVRRDMLLYLYIL